MAFKSKFRHSFKEEIKPTYTQFPENGKEQK